MKEGGEEGEEVWIGRASKEVDKMTMPISAEGNGTIALERSLNTKAKGQSKARSGI